MANFIYDFYFALPEIYLLVGIFFLLIFGVLISVSNFWGYPLLSKTMGLLSIQILFLTLILILYFPYLNIYIWNSFLISNYYILTLKIVISCSSILWIFFCFNYLKIQKINSFEYWILILLSILAFFFILQTQDLLVMYLAIEFQSLSFYVLASFKRSSEFSTEAGLKYFVLGAFSSAFLLFGSSLIYGLTGLSNFNDFASFFSGFLLFTDSTLTFGIFLGLIFISSALFFKLSSAPFHMWAPDVYEGSPTSTTAFFAIFPKIVILTLLIRLFTISFFDFFPIWQNFFWISIIFSLFIGSLGALYQKKWKRFLAYSSINHVGFILMGFLSGESFGVFSLNLYLLIYVITTFSIFSFLIDFKILSYPKENQIRYLNEIINLGNLNPLLAISLTLILFSMVGIPPLSGFFAKIIVLLISLQNGMYSLVILAVLASSIACFYYIKLIQTMYFLEQKKQFILIPISKINSLILGSSCLFILFFFIDIELFSILLTKITLSFI